MSTEGFQHSFQKHRGGANRVFKSAGGWFNRVFKSTGRFNRV